MRLAAIYIKEHFLFKEPQTINLGGKYFYNITPREGTEKEYDISRKENPNFIENFWGENIALVSAIVGGNGSGKTSALRVINDFNDNSENYIYVFEYNDNKLNYFSSSLIIKNDITERIEKIDLNLQILYYSPTVDYDLTSINSPINMVEYFHESIYEYYLDNIIRHLVFFNNTELINKLKSIYSNFPFYQKLIIKANQLYRSDFSKVYIESTLGNSIYRSRTNMQRKVKEDGKIEFTSEEEISNFFEENKTTYEALKDIWKVYDELNNVSDSSGLIKIHDGKNFIQNLEVNILSFLVINDNHAMDGDNMGYDFDKILKAENFIDRLNHFLKKYIANSSRINYETLEKKFKENFTIQNSENILKEIDHISGFKSDILGKKNVKIDKLKRDVNLFDNIYKFYTSIKQFDTNYANYFIDRIEIDIQNADAKLIRDFIENYKSLQSAFRGYIPKRSENILEIHSEKKLSSGEKAVIDLNASIYDFLIRYVGNHQYKEKVILLLDEADLGFHPDWKKRFIHAVTEILPLLFAENKVTKNIQIIITTHDPLTLSDIPNSNVVYLKKEGNKTKVLSEDEKPKKSFGANITDLLADSFFIGDGLIGDFAKGKIEETIKWLNDEKNLKDNDKNYQPNSEDYDKHKKIIELIDEKVIRMKLAEMLDELKDEKKFQIELAEKEIEYLKKKFDIK